MVYEYMSLVRLVPRTPGNLAVQAIQQAAVGAGLEAGRDIVKYLGREFRRSMGGGNNTAPVSGNGMQVSGGNRPASGRPPARKNAKRGKKRVAKGSGGLPGVSRGFGGMSQSMSIRVNGIIPILTTGNSGGNGQVSLAIPLSFTSVLGGTLVQPSGVLGQYFPNAQAIALAYRYFRFTSIKFDFRPELGYTASGYLGMCVDPFTAGFPINLAGIIRNIPSKSNDIKESFSIMWRPPDSRSAQPKLTALASGIVTVSGTLTSASYIGTYPPEDDLSQGTFQVYSNLIGVGTIGTEVGQVFLEATIQFGDPA